jgi:hypothetical protein
MQLEESLYTYLSTDSGISALISTRVYPEVAPQSASAPFLVYQRITTQRIHTMSADQGFVMATMQFTVWDNTITSARSVSEAVRAALQNHSGLTGGVGGVTINATLMENEINLYDEKTKSFGVAQEYNIFYYE